MATCSHLTLTSREIFQRYLITTQGLAKQKPEVTDLCKDNHTAAWHCPVLWETQLQHDKPPSITSDLLEEQNPAGHPSGQTPRLLTIHAGNRSAGCCRAPRWVTAAKSSTMTLSLGYLGLKRAFWVGKESPRSPPEMNTRSARSPRSEPLTPFYRIRRCPGACLELGLAAASKAEGTTVGAGDPEKVPMASLLPPYSISCLIN